MIGAADQIARDHLNLVKIKSSFIAAQCPFHKGGQERHPSFWINREIGSWGCFTCTAGGSNLKYLLRELGVHNRKMEAELDEAYREAEKVATLEKARRKNKAKASLRATHSLPENLLGVFDWTPTDLVESGFDEKLLAEHQIGFDTRNNRITFPVRDYEGALVGISGRAVEDGAYPKYLFYSGRRDDADGKEILGELGEWYPGYSNEDVRNHLWRIHLVYPELINETDGQVILVEGYKANLWLVQHDWYCTVASMGTKLTAAQERMLRKLGAAVFVLMDNNEPGREASKQICQRLAVSTFPVFECSYPDYCSEDAQPDDLTEAELASVLAGSKRAGGRYVKHAPRNAGLKKKRQKVLSRKRH